MLREEMKMILDELKKENISALKRHDQNARAIYSTVITKATTKIVEKREKDEKFTDEDMIRILQKTIKELIEEEENYIKVNNKAEAKLISIQRKLINVFLPKMLSKKEIEKIIKGQSDKSLPNIMKYFKANFGGKVDLRMVNEVLRSLK